MESKNTLERGSSSKPIADKKEPTVKIKPNVKKPTERTSGKIKKTITSYYL